MIPRIIHSCWFGGAPKPPLIVHCQESWRRHLPEYHFREWHEGNFDIERVPYVAEACQQRRWAFVTDYVRLWALYEYGGIYMDADVEVLRPLDRFLEHRAFTGHEADVWWLSATMGAEPSHPWIEMLLDYYEHKTFDDETPNTQVVTDLSRSWLEHEGSGYRFLREGVIIYPTEVFTPYDHQALRATPTEETYCVHHFAGSWLNGGRGRS